MSNERSELVKFLNQLNDNTYYFDNFNLAYGDYTLSGSEISNITKNHIPLIINKDNDISTLSLINSLLKILNIEPINVIYDLDNEVVHFE